MVNLRTLLVAGMMTGLAVQAGFAQTENENKVKGYPYAFVSVQGGGQVTFTNYKADKLITPIGAVSVGGMFTPAVGARIHVSGINEKGGLKSIDQTYDYKFVTSNLDLMLNLSQIVAPGKDHNFNAYLLGGVGLGYAWDNDDMKKLATAAPDQNLTLAWDDDRLVHNFRAGMQLEYNFTRAVAVNLEVTANNYHDRFNSKINGKGDWQVQALAGLTFKIGRGKAPRAVAATPVAPTVVKEAPATEKVAEAPKPVTPAPKPVVKPQPEKKPEPKVVVPAETQLEVFFDINQTKVSASEKTKLNDFAKWMKEHPSAKATVVGYADAGTGTSSINRRLSQQRVENVKQMLVKEYGIDAARLDTDYKGDTVQPFRNNDNNRVVIAKAKE